MFTDATQLNSTGQFSSVQLRRVGRHALGFIRLIYKLPIIGTAYEFALA
jgi:hypothetical protein